MDLTADQHAFLDAYARDVFGDEDDHLAGLMAEAVDAGFPDIAINAQIGRLLMILASLTPGRLAIEAGTLAGYSGIWIARGLAPGGRLITIESEDRHADFAERQFARAGVTDRVEVRRGEALDVLPRLAAELGPGSADLVFLDAVKAEYPDYWRLCRPLIAPGGLILADNIFGGQWFIGDEDHPAAIGVNRFNRLVAADDEFEAVGLPMRSGVLVGRRRR